MYNLIPAASACLLPNPPSNFGQQLRATSPRAKSRDHEIVRAQKKVSKGRPKTPPKSCNVVAEPQV
jgi:hypothetical protein